MKMHHHHVMPQAIASSLIRFYLQHITALFLCRQGIQAYRQRNFLPLGCRRQQMDFASLLLMQRANSLQFVAMVTIYCVTAIINYPLPNTYIRMYINGSIQKVQVKESMYITLTVFMSKVGRSESIRQKTALCSQQYRVHLYWTQK